MNIYELKKNLEIVLNEKFIKIKNREQAESYLISKGVNEEVITELDFLMDLKELIVLDELLDLRKISLSGEPLSNVDVNNIQYESTSEVDGLDKTFFGMGVRRYEVNIKRGISPYTYLTEVINYAIEKGTIKAFMKLTQKQIKRLLVRSIY